MPFDTDEETIDMQRVARRQGGSERHSCPVGFWTFMLKLGETFGWTPAGASYVVTPIRAKTHSPVLRHDYRPGARRDAKIVDQSDADRWANALALARRSKHLDGMIEGRDQPKSTIVQEARASDDQFLMSMDEFIVYLRKGTFWFAMRDRDNVRHIHRHRGPSSAHS